MWNQWSWLVWQHIPWTKLWWRFCSHSSISLLAVSCDGIVDVGWQPRWRQQTHHATVINTNTDTDTNIISSIAVILNIQGVHMFTFAHILLLKEKQNRHIKPFPMRIFKMFCFSNRVELCVDFIVVCVVILFQHAVIMWEKRRKKTFEAI